MSRNVRVRYVGPDPRNVYVGDLHIDDATEGYVQRHEVLVEPGQVISVPAEVAHGRPAKPEVWSVDGDLVEVPLDEIPPEGAVLAEEARAGVGGLLEQVDVWQPATEPKPTKAKAKSDPPPAD